jgi:hypothetical protein
LRSEDALGVIARCRQIIVVGDKKQLPPTSFFDRLTSGEAELEDGGEAPAPKVENAVPITDIESILSLCEARGLGSQMLRWHYRSRHPSLIEVSNAEFYHRLVMPPAPEISRTTKGLILQRVLGAYDRGGKRTNQVEAEAVAEAVASHQDLRQSVSRRYHLFDSAARSHR